MSFYQSNLHKRAPSVGTIKQGKHQCKTPKQSSSFSIDLYNYKKNTDKLNLSNILNTPATTSGSNLNCSFNQATLSSAAKSKSKNTCETVTHETFYLRPTSGQSSGRVDFQKILLLTKESRKNTTLEQTKEVESGLWDSPRSGADRNQEESSVSEEQVNQENSNNLRRKSEERKGLSRMANSGSNDYGTIKRLKEMIHKLQLKDAIQRQEITKLKRINEKIYADSRALEDRVQSLERIRNNEDYPHEKIDQKQSEKKGNRFEKSQRQGRNYSFNDSSYYESDAKPQKKSGNLMQQVERITAEKLKLEETLKNLLLDRELSKISINMNEIECSPTNQNLSRKFESIPLIPISNSNFGNLEFDAQTPHTQLKEPSPMNKKMQPNLRKSPNKSLQDSMITPKRNTNHQANDKSTERKVNKTDNQSSRDNSPSQTSILNSQRSKRVSPIDLIFNSNIAQSRKDQTPRILSNRNSPMARNSARKDYIPSPRLEKNPKDEQKRNNLSIDCNPRRHSGAELKAAVLNDSAITPIKALPLGKDILYREILEKNSKSYFEESRDQSGIFSEKDVNASYLNNVSPAVLDIISQYKYKQVKPSSRTSSVSNYYSKDSQGLNESYSTKLNLEQLFASNGREKENRKNSSEKGTEKSSASMISGANMFGQVVAQVKIDPQMIPKQIIGATDYKRGERAELVSEDKTHRKNPLDELNFAQKFTGCLPINISSLSQGNFNNSFQGAIEINDASLTPGVCPIILSAQPQGRQISSKRAQMALETLRAKMNKREA